MEQPIMSKTEKQWEAESDARVLAEAEIVKKDEKRLSAARKAAKHLIEDEKKRAEEREDMVRALQDISEGILSYPSMK